jgi:hypothetical protein
MSEVTTSASRRILRFSTIDDALEDVRILAAADATGSLRCLGNWGFGQNLNHLATWVDYAYDGAPIKLPFFIPWLLRPMKNRILTKPMRAGSRLPRVPGGTLAVLPVPNSQGLAHFQTAFTRLKNEAPRLPNVLLGPLTHAQWIAMNLRHAELHLSFLLPD